MSKLKKLHGILEKRRLEFKQNNEILYVKSTEGLLINFLDYFNKIKTNPDEANNKYPSLPKYDDMESESILKKFQLVDLISQSYGKNFNQVRITNHTNHPEDYEVLLDIDPEIEPPNIRYLALFLYSIYDLGSYDIILNSAPIIKEMLENDTSGRFPNFIYSIIQGENTILDEVLLERVENKYNPNLLTNKLIDLENNDDQIKYLQKIREELLMIQISVFLLPHKISEIDSNNFKKILEYIKNFEILIIKKLDEYDKIQNLKKNNDSQNDISKKISIPNQIIKNFECCDKKNKILDNFLINLTKYKKIEIVKNKIYIENKPSRIVAIIVLLCENNIIEDYFYNKKSFAENDFPRIKSIFKLPQDEDKFEKAKSSLSRTYSAYKKCNRPEPVKTEIELLSPYLKS